MKKFKWIFQPLVKLQRAFGMPNNSPWANKTHPIHRNQANPWSFSWKLLLIKTKKSHFADFYIFSRIERLLNYWMNNQSDSRKVDWQRSKLKYFYATKTIFEKNCSNNPTLKKLIINEKSKIHFRICFTFNCLIV
jgi:hypothetical protein